MIQAPPGHVLVIFPQGEAQLVKDYRLTDLKAGTVTGTVVREDKTLDLLLASLPAKNSAAPAAR